MNDAACLADEKQTGAKAVEGVGKGCSFGDIHRHAPCPAAGGRRPPPIEGQMHIPLCGERLVGWLRGGANVRANARFVPQSTGDCPASKPNVLEMAIAPACSMRHMM